MQNRLTHTSIGFDTDLIIQQLSELLDDDASLTQHLLSREFISQDQKNRLLERISYTVANDVSNQEIREYALELSRSSDYEEAIAGLKLLSSVNITVDAEVRQRLLEFGTASQDPEVLTRVMATLSSPATSDSERATVVEFFAEMTGSENASVRALAVQRLAQWDKVEPGSGTANMLSTLSADDSDPAVRAFSIQALTTQGEVYPEDRSQLFTIVMDPQEDPMVKIAAAEALDKLQLSESDIQVINAALLGEDFQLDQRH